MKWIKTAIGAVIGVISIGIIATIVYKMTHSSEVIEKEVSFEIVYEDYYGYEYYYYPISIYNEILEYGVIDEYGTVTNIVSCYVNNDEIDVDFDMYIASSSIIFSGYITSPDDDIAVFYEIDLDGYAINAGEIDGDVNIKFIFDVPQPPQLTGIIATLVLLVPIVFVSGVLYFYKSFKKD